MNYQEELDAFIGLNESYIEMESKEPPPPRCHMKPMIGVGGERGEWWYECHYCSHTKHGCSPYPGER